MTLAEKITKAFQLGYNRNEAPYSFAFNSEAMALLSGNEIGNPENVPVLKAFNTGVQKRADELADEIMSAEEAHAEALEMDAMVNQTAIFLSSKEFRGQWQFLKPHQQLISISMCHTKALEMNAVREEQMKPKNYGYRPSLRIMSAVERKMFLNFAHDEALEINQKMDTWAQVSDLMVKHTTPYAMDAVHAEALEMDAEYQRAIATIADNLSMPVWDGCSDTVKAEVVKHHHAEALEEDYRFHRLKARWWDFWASYSESERQDELEEAHVEALEMNKAPSL